MIYYRCYECERTFAVGTDKLKNLFCPSCGKQEQVKKVAGKTNAWKTKETIKLCQMWEEGFRVKEIAKEIGRTEESTYKMVRRQRKNGNLKLRYSI